MQEIINKYRKWKAENPDPDYQYDMIHEFFNGELSRGDMQSLADFAEEKFTSTNSTMPKCPKCRDASEVVDAFRCFACDEWFEDGTSA